MVFDGWDAEGQPVGKPWSEVRTPIINIAAVSEDQTANTYLSLMEMLDSDNLFDDYPGLEPMSGFVNLPRGRINPISASGTSIKGARTVFGVMDQTEVWTKQNGGVNLAETMRSNAAKIGGTTLETPNAFIPGMGSVAEHSANYAMAVTVGDVSDDGLLWDHREAPADTDLADDKSLLHGLRWTYGDSSKHEDGCIIHNPPCPPGHVDMYRLMAEIRDFNKDVQVARSDFLNQITHASDAWFAQYDWLACEDKEKTVENGDTIVLGFDGSRGRARGNADATALVGMRVSDRHLFVIGIWEPVDGDPEWLPPVIEIDRTVRETFKNFNVVGFYADPSGWQTHVAEWEAAFARKLKIRATGREPIALWPRGKTANVSSLTEDFYTSVMNKEITHDGHPRLLNHVLNARRRRSRGGGYLLYKEFPESVNKIDGAYASIMAFKACVDAQSKGIGSKKQGKSRVVFMR